MPSRIIGRCKCHLCGFDSAHVRESEKCLQAFCPDCKTQVIYRTPRQRELLAPLMRADKLAALDTQPPAPAIPAPSASSAAPTTEPPPEPEPMPSKPEPAAPAAAPAPAPKRAKKTPAAPAPAAAPVPPAPAAPPAPADRPRASWWGV